MSRRPHVIPWISHTLETRLIPESFIYPFIATFQVNNNSFKSCLLLSIYYVPDSWHVIAQILTIILWDIFFSHFSSALTCQKLTLLANNRDRVRAQTCPPTQSQIYFLRQQINQCSGGNTNAIPKEEGAELPASVPWGAFPFRLQNWSLKNI